MTTEDDIDNPFDITRTEYFNSNYALIADCFEEPSFYNDLMERERFIIVGNRGTGKTMILKSLYLPVFINSLRKRGIDVSKFGWKFVGVYVPCDNLDLQKYLNESYMEYLGVGDSKKGYIVWRRYLSNYLAIYIVKQILDTILNYGLSIGLDFTETDEITQKILEKFDASHLIRANWPQKFDDLPAFLEREKRIFLDFVMNRIQGSDETFCRPIVDLSFIKDVSNQLLEHFEQISSCRFYILLDDFFPPFFTYKQQAVLLDLIRERGGPLSFKITTIPEGMIYVTESGYEMRPELDYHQKSLEFSAVGQGSEYLDLIKEITNKRLVNYNCDFSSLFEDPRQTSKDFLLRLRGEVSKGHDRPVYAGFDMIVEMSSGVIGTYLLLVREMVNLALKNKNTRRFSKGILPIPADIQNEVIRSRSELFLSSILSLEDGQSLYKLVAIMARESRQLFLTNPRAKEYIQFKIKNYEDLLKGEKKAHRKLIVAVRNNIFHAPDSYPTDRHKNIILRTLIINRLLTPALKIPYRDRWAVDKPASEIEAILTSDATKPQPITGQQPLPVQFKTKQEPFKPIIAKTSCSIFSGQYCLRTEELLAQEEGAFLALPFREDWHRSTETLIKNRIGKRKVITSLDVSPDGDFTCKVCQCITRREYGIYEISVLNENVIFEMGLSLGLGKPTFAVWNKEWWDKTWGKPESPIMFLIDGFEGFPYFVSERNGIDEMVNKIEMSLKQEPWNKEEIRRCAKEENIFLCFPLKSVYYDKYLKGEALKALDEIGFSRESIAKLPNDFKEGLTLMNTFRLILRSKLCIIDSTQMHEFTDQPEHFADYLWRMFSLGVAAGLRKPLIHCFNTNYTQVVASDIRGKCTFVYKDAELRDKLLKSLKEVIANVRSK